jgi:hypothetical protein
MQNVIATTLVLSTINMESPTSRYTQTAQLRPGPIKTLEPRPHPRIPSYIRFIRSNLSLTGVQGILSPASHLGAADLGSYRLGSVGARLDRSPCRP